MTNLQVRRRMLLAGFTIIPAIGGFVGTPGAHLMSDPQNCTANQHNVDYFLHCAPYMSTAGWVPFNDWNNGAPSESGLTAQNQFRHGAR